MAGQRLLSVGRIMNSLFVFLSLNTLSCEGVRFLNASFLCLLLSIASFICFSKSVSWFSICAKVGGGFQPSVSHIVVGCKCWMWCGNCLVLG
jgi:hypothetical protein